MSAFKGFALVLGAVVGALGSVAAGVARADEPHLSAVSVAIDEGRVAVSVRLEDAFDDAMMERIATGLPTGIEYQFRLDRDRKRWFDASLDTSKLEVVAMYNAVTTEYLVNFKLDGKLIESRMVRDRDALEVAMTRIEGLPIFELTGTYGDERLLVRARADLGSKTGFLFLPTRIGTGWHRSRKFRATDGAG